MSSSPRDWIAKTAAGKPGTYLQGVPSWHQSVFQCAMGTHSAFLDIAAQATIEKPTLEPHCYNKQKATAPSHSFLVVYGSAAELVDELRSLEALVDKGQLATTATRRLNLLIITESVEGVKSVREILRVADGKPGPCERRGLYLQPVGYWADCPGLDNPPMSGDGGHQLGLPCLVQTDLFKHDISGGSGASGQTTDKWIGQQLLQHSNRAGSYHTAPRSATSMTCLGILCPVSCRMLLQRAMTKITVRMAKLERHMPSELHVLSLDLLYIRLAGPENRGVKRGKEGKEIKDENPLRFKTDLQPRLCVAFDGYLDVPTQQIVRTKIGYSRREWIHRMNNIQDQLLELQEEVDDEDAKDGFDGQSTTDRNEAQAKTQEEARSKMRMNADQMCKRAQKIFHDHLEEMRQAAVSDVCKDPQKSRFHYLLKHEWCRDNEGHDDELWKFCMKMREAVGESDDSGVSGSGLCRADCTKLPELEAAGEDWFWRTIVPMLRNATGILAMDL